MAKTVGQVRFYGDGDRRNYPQGLTISQLQSGVCFNDYYPKAKKEEPIKLALIKSFSENYHYF